LLDCCCIVNLATSLAVFGSRAGRAELMLHEIVDIRGGSIHVVIPKSVERFDQRILSKSMGDRKELANVTFEPGSQCKIIDAECFRYQSIEIDLHSSFC
jgi:hypothetical protein